MANQKSTKLSLEKYLNELEALVDKMESKELSLEESLSLFERGIALTKTCQKMLIEAKQKIEVISGEESSVTKINE